MFHAAASPPRRRVWALFAAIGLLLPAFAAQAATNVAPTISGSPKTFIKAGNAYAFVPTAADANGDKLTFKIVNKPGWMWFNAATGKLAGTPGAKQAGRTFSGIKISVTDGVSTVSLPTFWITVGAGSTATTNRAPTISGTPVTTATVGVPYAWKPTAADADGDKLTFSITGKPAWAAFDTTDGTLYGTPSATGTFPNVVLKVTDGKATKSLPAFSITVTNAATRTVTLNWTAPTTNTDGSALTDLSGYTVSYGTSSGSYSTSLRLTGASTTSVVVEGLAPGTWYFAIKSRTNAGTESAYSGEVSATL